MNDGVRSGKFGAVTLPGRPKKRAQEGLTLIELLIVIAVGVLILAGVAAFIQRAFSGANLSKETQNINLIMTEMRSIRSAAGYGAPNADLVPLMISLELAPPSLLNGNALVNSWNGSVNVKSTGTSFAIEYEKVPQKDCSKLVTNFSQAGTFVSIGVGGTTKVGPISPSESETLCADKNENKLIFTSRR